MLKFGACLGGGEICASGAPNDFSRSYDTPTHLRTSPRPPSTLQDSISFSSIFIIPLAPFELLSVSFLFFMHVLQKATHITPYITITKPHIKTKANSPPVPAIYHLNNPCNPRNPRLQFFGCGYAAPGFFVAKIPPKLNAHSGR